MKRCCGVAEVCAFLSGRPPADDERHALPHPSQVSGRQHLPGIGPPPQWQSSPQGFRPGNCNNHDLQPDPVGRDWSAQQQHSGYNMPQYAGSGSGLPLGRHASLTQTQTISSGRCQMHAQPQQHQYYHQQPQPPHPQQADSNAARPQVAWSSGKGGSSLPQHAQSWGASGVGQQSMPPAAQFNGRVNVEMPSMSQPSVGAPKLSFASSRALHQLEDVETALRTLEQDLESLSGALRSGEEVGSIRNRLTQLEVKARDLEEVGLDTVATSGLRSGKQHIKGFKRKQLQRLETFFARLDDAFRACSAPKSVQRNNIQRLSAPSEAAVQRLGNVKNAIAIIEAEAGKLEQDVLSRRVTVSVARTRLADLESRAKRIESDGLDGLPTSELRSGQQLAKQMKREQLARLEVVFSNIDSLFIETGCQD